MLISNLSSNNTVCTNSISNLIFGTVIALNTVSTSFIFFGSVPPVRLVIIILEVSPCQSPLSCGVPLTSVAGVVGVASLFDSSFFFAHPLSKVPSNDIAKAIDMYHTNPPCH